MFSSWILFLAEQVRKNTPDLSPWHMPWGEKITENHVIAYQVRKTTSSIKNRFIKYFIVANSQEIYVGAFIIPILQTKKISHRWFRPQVMWYFSSSTRDRPHSSCIGRWNLNHRTTSGSPIRPLLKQQSDGSWQQEMLGEIYYIHTLTLIGE